MNYDVVAGQPTGQMPLTLEVALYEESATGHQLAVARREVVQHGNLMAGLEQLAGDMTAQKSRAAGYKHAH